MIQSTVFNDLFTKYKITIYECVCYFFCFVRYKSTLTIGLIVFLYLFSYVIFNSVYAFDAWKTFIVFQHVALLTVPVSHCNYILCVTLMVASQYLKWSTQNVLLIDWMMIYFVFIFYCIVFDFDFSYIFLCYSRMMKLVYGVWRFRGIVNGIHQCGWLHFIRYFGVAC